MSWRQSVTAGDILLFLTWPEIAIQRVIAAGTNLTKEALIRKLCEKHQTECRYGRLLGKPGASSTKATLFSPQVCFENAALEKLHRRRCRCVILLYYPMSTSYCVPECQQKGGKSSAGEKVWFFEFPLRTWRENRKKNLKKKLMADSPTTIMLRVCDTTISYSTTKPKICRSSHSYPINSFHLYISIQILLTVFSTFPKVLTGRMCLTIGSFLNWWSFPLFSWPLHLIQGWCCKEKLEANPTKMLRG